MKNILIIEDEPAIVMILEELLTDEGYHVLTAPNGHEGLAILSSATVDLVIVDMNMPGISGKQVIDKVRKELSSILPVIVVTGSELELIDCPDFNSYQILIRKPFDLDQVLTSIKKLID